MLRDDPSQARHVGPLVVPIIERLIEQELHLQKQPDIPHPNTRDTLYWAALSEGLLSRSLVRKLLRIAALDSDRNRLLPFALATAARDDPVVRDNCTPLPKSFVPELVVNRSTNLGILRIMGQVARVTPQQAAIADSYGLLILIVRSGTPEYEYTALRTIGEIQREIPTDVFLDELVRHARRSDDPRRRAALYALGQYARAYPADISPYLRCFTDAITTGSYRTRVTALAGLVTLVNSIPQSLVDDVLVALRESVLSGRKWEYTLGMWISSRLLSETSPRFAH